VAQSLSNLGLVYKFEGRYREGRPEARRSRPRAPRPPGRVAEAGWRKNGGGLDTTGKPQQGCGGGECRADRRHRGSHLHHGHAHVMEHDEVALAWLHQLRGERSRIWPTDHPSVRRGLARVGPERHKHAALLPDGQEALTTAGTLQRVAAGIEHQVMRRIRSLAAEDGEHLAVLHALDVKLDRGGLLHVDRDQVVVTGRGYAMARVVE